MGHWKGQTEYNDARSSCGKVCPSSRGEGRVWSLVDEDYFPCPGVPLYRYTEKRVSEASDVIGEEAARSLRFVRIREGIYRYPEEPEDDVGIPYGPEDVEPAT